MKLAEALMIRAQMQQRLEALQSRILANLKVQEGEAPLEDPQALLAQAFETNERLCEMVQRINARNNSTRTAEGKPLTALLAERDMLMRKRNLLAACAAKAVEPNFRQTRAEVKQYVTVSVADMQKQMDALSHQLREMDVSIQAINWATEL